MKDHSFDKSFAQHELCSLCGHGMLWHKMTDWKGNPLRIPQCCIRMAGTPGACYCGRQPDLPLGYFEIQRKMSDSGIADIVLAQKGDTYVTISYNPIEVSYKRWRFYVGEMACLRAKEEYAKRWI